MPSVVLMSDLSLDCLAKRLSQSRRTVQVLMLFAHYGELTTGDVAKMLDVSVKTLRDRHLPRLMDLHWIRGERLVTSGPPTERWKISLVKRKRADLFYLGAQRDVAARLQSFEHRRAPTTTTPSPALGSMK